MTEEIQNKRWSIGKKLTIGLLAILVVWQCLIAYQIFELSKLFEEFEPANYKVGFMISMQPFAWVMIILTVGIILDIAKRSKFLIINTVLIIAVIIMTNASLSLFIAMEGYEPIFKMNTE